MGKMKNSEMIKSTIVFNLTMEVLDGIEKRMDVYRHMTGSKELLEMAKEEIKIYTSLSVAKFVEGILWENHAETIFNRTMKMMGKKTGGFHWNIKAYINGYHKDSDQARKMIYENRYQVEGVV
jgi:hypothetical protein